MTRAILSRLLLIEKMRRIKSMTRGLGGGFLVLGGLIHNVNKYYGILWTYIIFYIHIKI